ncbi:hypothetical protein BT69DRAFT_1280590, partial [Atractiella rhizophila]
MLLRCPGSISTSCVSYVLYFRDAAANSARLSLRRTERLLEERRMMDVGRGRCGERDAGAREARVVARIIGSG